jgi:hypothetical protein
LSPPLRSLAVFLVLLLALMMPRLAQALALWLDFPSS